MSTVQLHIFAGSNEFSGFRGIIDWPIVNETKKAVQVQTPGGLLWFPNWKRPKKFWSCATVDTLLAEIKNVSSSSSEALVPVLRAGKGPTDKSLKVRVQVHRFTLCDETDEWSEGSSIAKFRCFTLARSQLMDVDGALFAPMWMMKKRLRRGESIVSGVWTGLIAVESQIRAAVETAEAQAAIAAAARSGRAA